MVARDRYQHSLKLMLAGWRDRDCTRSVEEIKGSDQTLGAEQKMHYMTKSPFRRRRREERCKMDMLLQGRNRTLNAN